MSGLKGLKQLTDGPVVGCAAGKCPRVFLADDGDLVIQGLRVGLDLRNALNLHNDEEAVMLPKNTVKELFKKYRPE